MIFSLAACRWRALLYTSCGSQLCGAVYQFSVLIAPIRLGANKSAELASVCKTLARPAFVNFLLL